MRRIQAHVLGITNALSTGEIWLLGLCYKVSHEHGRQDEISEFMEDYASRILMTYRKGFSAITGTEFTSDVGWGCMLRSSQMLVAQALIVHFLGRTWRKPAHKISLSPSNEYHNILRLFRDSEASVLSIHNILQFGKVHGLTAGSWIGPYAICRTWELIARFVGKGAYKNEALPFAIYVVHGEEDGESGGAPILYSDDACTCCLQSSKKVPIWMPVLILVPLVLGLDKINSRYFSSLKATFTFPQNLGILGGRPGASTYIVGVQDENVLYLDPHEAQMVVDFDNKDLDFDTSSYHCNVVRHMPLDSLDPSLAIGFYCRDKADFDDLCASASNLAGQSNGAPLFTVAHSCKSSSRRQMRHGCINSDDEKRGENIFVVGEEWELL